MGLFSKLFGTDPESIRKTCIDIYEKAQRKKPGKSERDYLKLVLLTKPPYDYQLDKVIDMLLDEHSTIDVLADFIASATSKKSNPIDKEFQNNTWEARERNKRMFPEIKRRNEQFFQEFWG